jgi:hypothetical protein
VPDTPKDIKVAMINETPLQKQWDNIHCGQTAENIFESVTILYGAAGTGKNTLATTLHNSKNVDTSDRFTASNSTGWGVPNADQISKQNPSKKDLNNTQTSKAPSGKSEGRHPPQSTMIADMITNEPSKKKAMTASNRKSATEMRGNNKKIFSTTIESTKQLTLSKFFLSVRKKPAVITTSNNTNKDTDTIHEAGQKK